MKKGNIVLIHKKSNKQNLKNYRPVSILPISGKIFERLILNEIFNYSISTLINSSLKISSVSNPVIPAATNCFQLSKKFLNLLIMD